MGVSFAGNLTNSRFSQQRYNFRNFEVGNKILRSARIDVLHALLDSDCFIFRETFF